MVVSLTCLLVLSRLAGSFGPLAGRIDPIEKLDRLGENLHSRTCRKVMTFDPPRQRGWRFLIAAVSLTVITSLLSPYSNAQELTNHGKWRIGAFAAGGFAPNYEIHSPPFRCGV